MYFWLNIHIFSRTKVFTILYARINKPKCSAARRSRVYLFVNLFSCGTVYELPVPFYPIISHISHVCISFVTLWKRPVTYHEERILSTRRRKSVKILWQGCVYSIVPISDDDDVTTTMTIIMPDKHSKPPGSKMAMCLQTATYRIITFASTCIT